MEAIEMIGWLLYEIVGKHLPESTSKFRFGQKQFRYWCVKAFLHQCGKNVNIDKGANISRKCSIGNNSGIGKNSNIGITVTIGDDVMMGPECLILTRNHRFSDTNIPMRLQGYTEEKPVIIGNDVWIGSRVTILGGVHIGNHCIIGAGSVVTHDVADYDIVAGNPARVIRNRKEVAEMRDCGAANS